MRCARPCFVTRSIDFVGFAITRRVLMALMALIVAAGAGGTGCDRAAPLPVRGHVPAFTLTDATGAAFSRQSLAGTVWIANFIFTRCPDICPAFTAKMAEVQAATASAGPRLRLVSFSVDPAYDTPARLSTYAAQHGADPARWSFLTGPPDAVRAAVEQGLKVYMEQKGETGGVPQIGHGSHFVLVDRQGDIRGYYDMNDADAVTRVVRDARRLLR
jgi:protein SCO1/2